jgi:hypothetical protein
MKHLFLLAVVATFGMIVADSADARGRRGGLFGGRGGGHHGCASSCHQETTCCEPVVSTCCEQAAPCCEEEAPCGCDSGRHKHRRHRDRGCHSNYNDCGCQAPAYHSDCGCGSSYGGSHGGVIVHEGHQGGVPTEASPSDHQPAPEPPTNGGQNNGGQGGNNPPAPPEGGAPPAPPADTQGGETST